MDTTASSDPQNADHLLHHIIMTVAIIGGVIVFNVILLLIFWLVQRRRASQTQDKHFIMQSDDSLASVQSNATMASFPHQASPSALSSQVPPYMQTTKALQNSSTTLPSIPPSITFKPAPASLQTPSKTYTHREMKGKTLGADLHRSSAQRSIRRLQNTPHHMRRGPSLLRILSLKRKNSSDSVSVYSSASAPIDAHEYMFQSMTLEPLPLSAPAHITTHPDVPQPQPNHSNTQLSWQTSTYIREALAPETYAKPLPQKPLSPRLRPVPDFQGMRKVPLMSEHMKVPPTMRLPSVVLPLKLHTPPSSFRTPH